MQSAGILPHTRHLIDLPYLRTNAEVSKHGSLRCGIGGRIFIEDVRHLIYSVKEKLFHIRIEGTYTHGEKWEMISL